MPVSITATVTFLPVKPRDQACWAPVALVIEYIEPRSAAASKPPATRAACAPWWLLSSPHRVESIVLPTSDGRPPLSATAGADVPAAPGNSVAPIATAAADSQAALRLCMFQAPWSGVSSGPG